jgi:hypothetical protein
MSHTAVIMRPEHWTAARYRRAESDRGGGEDGWGYTEEDPGVQNGNPG